ncbi:hypothetical protein [Alloactinosynnema sp. L-07]|uniref:hypothetical protein n=1 Tax=Alloactinosynnema sp. L-07 TaxID=1653480 RepID=UPI0006B4383C|nr:hypothetical protein [Alloactinosynnema sp. L-07]
MTRPVLAVALTTVAFAVTTAIPPAAICQPKAAAPVVRFTPPPTATPVAEVDLAGAVAAGVGAAGGRITLGLSVLDLTTGRLAGNGGDRPFFSASISKMIVAVDVLSREVSAADRDRVWRALSASDDTAMNALWSLHDGNGAIGRVARLAGLTGTSAPKDPAEWGETTVTSDDAVRLQAYIQSSPARDFIHAALAAAPDTAADGFDQDFGLNGPGLDAFGKQAWMFYRPNAVYLHSAGVLSGRYAIALLSIQRGRSAAGAKEQVNAIAGAVAAALG